VGSGEWSMKITLIFFSFPGKSLFDEHSRQSRVSLEESGSGM